MSERRSPLRERLLHVPGQSLDETINRLWDDRGVMYAMAMATFVCVALVDWCRWLTHAPLRPWVTTVWAAVVTAYSIRGLIRLRKQTKLLEQGRDGERAVAEVLEANREQLLHTVGNLTLLNNKLNPTVSNGPWEQKRQGIASHSVIALNRRFHEQAHWNEAEMERRGLELFSIACRIWPAPAEGGSRVHAIPRGRISSPCCKSWPPLWPGQRMASQAKDN